MNFSLVLLKALVKILYDEGRTHPADSDEFHTYWDAADALGDLVDMLEESA